MLQRTLNDGQAFKFVSKISCLKKDAAFFLLLATVSLCVGLLINQFRDKPLPLVYQTKEERLQQSVRKLVEARTTEAKPVVDLPEILSLEEFAGFVENKRGVVLDARPEIFHRLGHVPGALSLPREDFENAYPALRPKLETDFSQTIVIYCASVRCEDAELVKKALAALGFTRLSIFKGGWTE